MKALKRSLLAAIAALGLGGGAQAATFASAILDINNFRLLHSGGAVYSTSDFSVLTGTNDAHATGARNGIFANGSASFGILSGFTPNVAHQCVGAPCPPLAEDNFLPFTAPPPVPGTFGHADQAMSGSAISICCGPVGVHAQTRADASSSVNAVASGNSSVGTSTTFSFTLGSSDTMNIAFDATPYSIAYVSAGAGPVSNANARLSWAINILNLTAGGVSIFDFTPAALNGLSAVSRTDGLPGTSVYNAALTMMSFSAVTPLLLAGNTYQITIEQNTLANVLQQQVPEPASLSILAAGLLGMSLLSRRRRL
ncbi:PEP-CTERM sorting domain-containing protein [Massilia sp. MB5]|uniref:EDSAP-1 family PEP-CTERM protein n=1 Tax=Massilia sp. MB5 TaxID=2919578 RepID=UPI001F102D51|nr:EDSAP-1 family PEP-CTERM protein [Massilia sp. MB5]UMR29330.1 PEP-CTERM sorting domain-containing protein [Massilia sp. MB5]